MTTLNPNDAVNDEPRVVATRRPDNLSEIEAAIERSILARAMPAWGEETWEGGKISNGEVP